MLQFRTQLIVIILTSTLSAPLWAGGSPWLPVPQSGTVGLSYVSQSAEQFWRGPGGTDRGDLPFGELDQKTTWLHLNYGLLDSLAIDVDLGWSEASRSGPGDEEDGMADSTVGLTWRFLDEDTSENGAPSMALRVAGILAHESGDDVAKPHAISNGGDGIEASLMVGKIFADRFALSGEIGRRERNESIPAETFFNLTAYVLPTPRLTLSAQYHETRSSGNIDIGTPTGPRGPVPGSHYLFARVAEDVSRVGIVATYRIGDKLTLGVNYFDIIDGRNTADFDVWASTLSYAFDLYNP